MSDTQDNSLFILKNKAASLRSAEKFLENRGWSVSSGISLRELIAYLIQRQPQFILVPADFPNKKIKILPQLLEQAFPVTIVGYVELATGQAVTLLSDMRLRFQILPPVSGPQIERTLLRIQKEIQEEAEYQRKNAENKGGEGSGFLRFSGEASSGGPTHISGDPQSEESRNRTSMILQELLGQEERQDSSAIQQGDLSNEDLLKALAERGLAEQSRRSKIQQQARGPQYTPNESGTPESSTHKESPNPASQQNPSEEPNSNPSGSNNQDSPDGFSDNEQDSNKSGRPSKKTPLYEYDPILKRNRPVPQYNFKEGTTKIGSESILVKGTKHALDKSVRVIPYLPEYEEVQETKNCVCLTLNSPQFSGYLVAAFGWNRKIDQKFFKIVQEKLLSFLRSYGEIPKEYDAISIEIQEVEFEDWALEQADFLKKSLHGDTEIAMAFFPSSETQLKIGESVSKRMLALNLEELRGDSELEFDTYLFMPNNNRYLLYVAAQGTFFKSQKDRLKKSGIESLHIRKEAVANVKKYKTQNFLNDKIEIFKKVRKRSAKKAS